MNTGEKKVTDVCTVRLKIVDSELWLNMRSVCCVFLGIIGLLSQRRLFNDSELEKIYMKKIFPICSYHRPGA